jgi:hypothetical protein
MEEKKMKNKIMTATILTSLVLSMTACGNTTSVSTETNEHGQTEITGELQTETADETETEAENETANEAEDSEVLEAKRNCYFFINAALNSFKSKIKNPASLEIHDLLAKVCMTKSGEVYLVEVCIKYSAKNDLGNTIDSYARLYRYLPDDGLENTSFDFEEDDNGISYMVTNKAASGAKVQYNVKIGEDFYATGEGDLSVDDYAFRVDMEDFYSFYPDYS